MSFHFAVVDLARLEATEYANKLNAAALALSSRMRTDPDRRLALALDIVRIAGAATIGEPELEAAMRFFFVYQKFSGEEGLKLQKELGSMGDMDIPKRILLENPLVQFGINKGRSEGLRRETELVLRLLSRRLGTIPATHKNVIRKFPRARIEALGEALLDFRTKADLTRWLKSHSA